MRAIEPPSGRPNAFVLPVITTLPAGSRLWRIHPTVHHPPSGAVDDDGTLFNPGVGDPTRFAPLLDGSGANVPTMYVGATRRGALFETFLHDQMPLSTIDSRKWAEHVLTPLETHVDINLVMLHGHGLRSLGLHAADITHTLPTEYPRATRWAEWLHHHTMAAGLTWTSHQDDDERAFVLWGDRLPAGAITPESHPIIGGTPSLPVGFGPGLDWAEGQAASIRVKVI